MAREKLPITGTTVFTDGATDKPATREDWNGSMQGLETYAAATNEKITGQTATISVAIEAANQAKEAAGAAGTKADAATTAAGEAKTAAEGATTSAGEAKAEAQAASEKAEAASSAAANAQTAAQEASTAATSASGSAAAAKTAADTASANAQAASQGVEQVKTEVADLEKATFSMEGKRTVWFGDSIMLGQSAVGDNYYDRPYPTVFGEITGASVQNLADGGSTMSSYVYANISFVNKVKATSLSGFDYLFFCFGTNDYGNNVPMGTPDSTAANTFMGAMENAISYISTTYPLLKVVCLVPTFAPTNTVPNTLGYTMDAYKNAICRIAAKWNIPVIDLDGGMGYNANNWNAHIWDTTSPRLHPNQKTHEEIGNYIAKSISAQPSQSKRVYSGYNSRQPISLASGVTNYTAGHPATYWLDSEGNLWLDASGYLAGTGPDIGTIPAAYAPASTVYFPIIAGGGAAPTTGYITNTGKVSSVINGTIDHNFCVCIPRFK